MPLGIPSRLLGQTPPNEKRQAASVVLVVIPAHHGLVTVGNIVLAMLVHIEGEVPHTKKRADRVWASPKSETLLNKQVVCSTREI